MTETSFGAILDSEKCPRKVASIAQYTGLGQGYPSRQGYGDTLPRR